MYVFVPGRLGGTVNADIYNDIIYIYTYNIDISLKT